METLNSENMADGLLVMKGILLKGIMGLQPLLCLSLLPGHHGERNSALPCTLHHDKLL
jgi:hypothetical protein